MAKKVTSEKPKPAPTETRAGFAAIIGPPNAGKSTLLNHLIGKKLSIVSPKAQTTRLRILGIVTAGHTQIGFLDTPGIFAPKRRLDRAMVQAAWGSLDDADAIILLLDARTKLDDKVLAIIEELKRRQKKVVVALNKVDSLQPERLLPLAAAIDKTEIAEHIFMISALTGDGVIDLKKYVAGKMPKSPWYYEPDRISDLPAALTAAEITREQLYLHLQQELPYGAAVVPESWEERANGSIAIYQTIIIQRDNHRPIVLGKGGAKLKTIGSNAREGISRFLGKPTHLFLDVKVDSDWQERHSFYEMFGLDFASGGK